MDLEQILSEEDKEYILNELVRERRKKNICDIYEKIITVHTRSYPIHTSSSFLIIVSSLYALCSINSTLFDTMIEKVVKDKEFSLFSDVRNIQTLGALYVNNDALFRQLVREEKDKIEKHLQNIPESEKELDYYKIYKYNEAKLEVIVSFIEEGRYKSIGKSSVFFGGRDYVLLPNTSNFDRKKYIESKKEKLKESPFLEITNCVEFVYLFKELSAKDDSYMLKIAGSSLILLADLDIEEYIKLYQEAIHSKMSLKQAAYMRSKIISDSLPIIADSAPALMIELFSDVLEQMLSDKLPNDCPSKKLFSFICERIIDYDPDFFISQLSVIKGRLAEKMTLSSLKFFDEKAKENLMLESLPYLVEQTLTQKKLLSRKDDTTTFFQQYLDSKAVQFRDNDSKHVILNKLIELVHKENELSYAQLITVLKFDEVKNLTELLECSTIQSPYQMVCKLGQGASGTIYKVYSPELDDTLALKIINKNISHLEARVMAQLRKMRNDYIVNIYDAGNHLVKIENQEKYAIIMELIDGKSLDSILKEYEKENKRLKPGLLYSYAGSILNAIIAFYERDIIHRDLYPSNIIIENDTQRIVIVDFGNATINTENYPTEPKDCRRYGGSDDLFSYGLLLYKMATGNHLMIDYARSIAKEDKAQLDMYHNFESEKGTTSNADWIAQNKSKILSENGILNGEYIRFIYNNLNGDLRRYREQIIGSLSVIGAMSLNLNTTKLCRDYNSILIDSQFPDEYIFKTDEKIHLNKKSFNTMEDIRLRDKISSYDQIRPNNGIFLETLRSQLDEAGRVPGAPYLVNIRRLKKQKDENDI